MKNPLIEKQIINRLQLLEESQQLQVLDFATSLAKKEPTGIPGKDLLRFAGSISDSDLELMSYTIDRECRKIDFDEW